jgi:hypothetical protein
MAKASAKAMIVQKASSGAIRGRGSTKWLKGVKNSQKRKKMGPAGRVRQKEEGSWMEVLFSPLSLPFSPRGEKGLSDKS